MATQAILLPSTVASFGPGSAGFRDGEFLRVFGNFLWQLLENLTSLGEFSKTRFICANS
jgi:hypothetical protein